MSKKYKGIIFIIISSFCFALMSIFVRLSGDLPSVEKSFFRNFMAVFFAFFVMKKSHLSFEIKKGDLKYLIGRSAFGTVGLLCNYYAVDHLLVADANMLNKLSPFFVIIFSFLILKEKIKLYQGVCLVIAFIGTIFVIRPTGMQASFPALIGVIGGMGAGMAYTFVRILGHRNVKGPFIVFFFSAFSSLVVLPMMLLDFQPMTLGQFGCLLMAALAATGGQFAVTTAYTYAPGREISIYDYSQIIFSTLLSFFILGQVPTMMSFIGYFIIVGASILMFILNQKNTERDLV